MASVPSPTSSKKRKRKVSSSSPRTRSPAATSSRRPSRVELLASKNKGIRDVIAPDLRVLFVGINPGLYTAWTGHHFARPGNRFWPALHFAGFSRRQLHPSQQAEL